MYLFVKFEPLNYVLVLFALVGDKVNTDRIHKPCVINICGHELFVDLIVSDMHDFDVILSMDYLFATMPRLIATIRL